jgi:hypothetical protein
MKETGLKGALTKGSQCPLSSEEETILANDVQHYMDSETTPTKTKIVS